VNSNIEMSGRCSQSTVLENLSNIPLTFHPRTPTLENSELNNIMMNDTAEIDEYIKIHKNLKCRLSFTKTAKKYIASKRSNFDRRRYCYPNDIYVRNITNIKPLKIESSLRKMPNFMTRRPSDEVRFPNCVKEVNGHLLLTRTEYHYHMLNPLKAPFQYKGQYLWKEKFNCFNPFCLKANVFDLNDEDKCNWKRCVGTIDGQCHIEEKGHHCKEIYPSVIWFSGIPPDISGESFWTIIKQAQSQK
jgi:hypothetical protein